MDTTYRTTQNRIVCVEESVSLIVFADNPKALHLYKRGGGVCCDISDASVVEILGSSVAWIA